MLKIIAFFILTWSVKMQNKEYNTVGTFLKSQRKYYEEAKFIPLTHKYMTAHFPGLVQACQ
jgi:hypothetical protein